VVLLPLLTQLVKDKIAIFLVVRSLIQQECCSLLPGLAGAVRESDFYEMGLDKAERFLDFLGHQIIQTYCHNTARFKELYAPMRMNGVLSEICHSWGLPCDFSRLDPLPFKAIRKLGDTVLLVPGATSNTKRWAKDHWLILCKEIERYGLKSAVLGQPERSGAVRELISANVKWVETNKLSQALNVISSARCTVACDTGLMHLSVQQGKPTIALFGHDTFWYRPYPHCFPIYSPGCQARCLDSLLALEAYSGNWAKERRNFDETGWTGTDYLSCAVSDPAACMSEISPQAVIDCLKKNILALT
jgi:ADP-heptose:LPS heptosyltransferase